MTQDYTPTLAQVIDHTILSVLSGVHTSMPGIVDAYDAATQTVKVQPAVEDLYYDEDGEEHTERFPVLEDVPVAFPRAGDFFISFPLKKGDSVLLVFGERSMDQWQGSGKVSDPGDLRKFSLSDAVAIPGLFPSNKALKDAHAQNMVIGKDGGPQIHFKSDAIHLGQENATDFVALAGLVKAQLQALKNAINLAVPTAGAADGGAGLKTSLMAALSAWPADVKATKVKAT